MELNERIFKLLSETGKTSKDLSAQIGVKPSSISAWKNEGSYPSSKYIQGIANFLGVTTDYLLTGNNPPQNQQVTTGNIHNTGAMGIHNHAPVTISNGIERELSKQEQDLLRIYNTVDGKKQMEIMKFVYDIEY